jgi:hypothetical protein
MNDVSAPITTLVPDLDALAANVIRHRAWTAGGRGQAQLGRPSARDTGGVRALAPGANEK